MDGSLVINHSLPQGTSISIELFNLKGQLIFKKKNTIKGKGLVSITPVNPGIKHGCYFYRISFGNEAVVQKAFIIK